MVSDWCIVVQVFVNLQYDEPVRRVDSAANWSSVNFVESSCHVS